MVSDGTFWILTKIFLTKCSPYLFYSLWTNYFPSHVSAPLASMTKYCFQTSNLTVILSILFLHSLLIFATHDNNREIYIVHLKSSPHDSNFEDLHKWHDSFLDLNESVTHCLLLSQYPKWLCCYANSRRSCSFERQGRDPISLTTKTFSPTNHSYYKFLTIGASTTDRKQKTYTRTVTILKSIVKVLNINFMFFS